MGFGPGDTDSAEVQRTKLLFSSTQQSCLMYEIRVTA